MRSPIVGLNAGEMARIRLHARRGDYLDAVVAASLSEKGTLGERLRDFLCKLESWRTAARQGTLADLIWTLYRETGYYDFVGGLPGGGQRQANLRHSTTGRSSTKPRLPGFIPFPALYRADPGGRTRPGRRPLPERE